MISYSPDEISAIITEIEHQGGAFLPEICNGQIVTYLVSNSERKVKVPTCKCGQESMAVVVYDPAGTAKARKQLAGRGGGFVRVCINCDHVGNWPRFKHVLEEEDV